jgi:hypothetical protein
MKRDRGSDYQTAYIVNTILSYFYAMLGICTDCIRMFPYIIDNLGEFNTWHWDVPY